MQKCTHTLAQPMDLCLVNDSIKTDDVEKFHALCVYTTSTATLQFSSSAHESMLDQLFYGVENPLHCVCIPLQQPLCSFVLFGM